MSRNYSWNTRNFDTVPLGRNFIDPLLKGLLSLCTPHKHEGHIVNLIKSLDYVSKHPMEELEGNLIVTVGTNPSSMFSCHMDIVGDIWKKNAELGKVDEIVLMTDPVSEKDKKSNLLWTGWLYGSKWYVDKKDNVQYAPSTLGADDKVGVYILLKMIEKEIPGMYVFHVGEEVGGTGSKYLSTTHADKFKEVKRAIAFDRANYGDVICFQRGGRCCSKEFGQALATQLNLYMPPKELFKSDVTGTFTDTANYTGIIPECTNLSVGYFNQHGPNEKLDYIWLKQILIPAIIQLEFDKLPVVRNPKEKEIYTSSYTPYSGNGGGYSVGKRKTWKEADGNTNIWDLPQWKPSDGLVEGANVDALQRAIRQYITNSTLTEKEVFVVDYMWNLEYIDILEKEVEALQDQMKMLVNKKKTGSVEDIELHKKKKYLSTLLKAARGIASEIYDPDAIFNYCNNVEKFLDHIKDRQLLEQLSKKDIKKLNKYIFTMAYCLSLEDNISEEIKELLIEIQKYIAERLTEDGFDTDPSAFFKKKIINSEPISTANTVH